MAYDLVRLSILTDKDNYKTAAEQQLDFLAQSAAQYPTNHAMFLTALLEYNEPPIKITVVPTEGTDITALTFSAPHDAIVILKNNTKDYPIINGRTTYYVCRGKHCMAPVNDLTDLR